MFSILGVSKEEQLRRAENVFILNREGIPAYKDVVAICEEKDPQQFYIGNKVVNMCDEIRISSDFDLGWLTPLKDGARQLNWGDHFIRYKKQGPDIIAVAVSRTKDVNKDEDLKYTFFKMDLNQKSVTGPVHDGDPLQPGTTNFSSKIYHDRCIDIFKRFLIFMELTDITEVLVPPGSKHGTRKAPDNLMNTAKMPVTVVSTNWNKKIIKAGEIEVVSHLRRQRWGPGFTQVKPIIIEEFVKKGYNLKAKKETSEKIKRKKR